VRLHKLRRHLLPKMDIAEPRPKEEALASSFGSSKRTKDTLTRPNRSSGALLRNPFFCRGHVPIELDNLKNSFVH